MLPPAPQVRSMEDRPPPAYYYIVSVDRCMVGSRQQTESRALLKVERKEAARNPTARLGSSPFLLS